MSQPTPEGTQPVPGPAGAWTRELRDPRLTTLNRAAFWFSIVMVVVAMLRLANGNWGNFSRHVWFHAFVVAWMSMASYQLRSVGTREMVRFWVTGFFPVVFVAYVLSEPLERLIGTGNLQTGVWVPVAEELVKLLPLLAWTTLLRPKHRHGTLSDFVLLGFCIGAGFSLHEDALYVRSVVSGFGDGLPRLLFPTIFDGGSQFTIAHAGWTAIGAMGVGIWSLYRRRPWALPVAAGLVAIPILDHVAINWRGGGAGFLLGLVGNGRVTAWVLVLVVFGAFAHDLVTLRWATARDRLFPPATVAGDVAAARAAGVPSVAAGRLVRLQQYRRFRNAAFVDLYRVRSEGASAGDRRAIKATLGELAHNAGIAPPRP